MLCFRPHEAFVPSPPHPPFHSRGPKPPLPPSVRPFRHPAGRPGPLRAGQRPAAVCGSSGAASAVSAVSVGVCHIAGGGGNTAAPTSRGPGSGSATASPPTGSFRPSTPKHGAVGQPSGGVSPHLRPFGAAALFFRAPIAFSAPLGHSTATLGSGCRAEDPKTASAAIGKVLCPTAFLPYL